MMTFDEAIEYIKNGGKVTRPRFKRIAYIFFRDSQFWYRLIDGREYRLPFFYYNWKSQTDWQQVEGGQP
jgi:hypothetical protein